jgi:hypothetical protein
MKCRKITFSISNQVNSDLAYIAGRIKVSKSSLVDQLLSEPLADLRVLIEDIPVDPTPDDLIRARGRSKLLIEQRIDDARGRSDRFYG